MWHSVQQQNTSQIFLQQFSMCFYNLKQLHLKLLLCSVMKSCKRGKSEKNFDATCFCHRGNFLEKFCRRGMTVKSRFQFYTQLHQTPCHNTTNMDCLKKIMLEITCHHFEGRNKRVRGPHVAQAWCTT